MGCIEFSRIWNIRYGWYACVESKWVARMVSYFRSIQIQIESGVTCRENILVIGKLFFTTALEEVDVFFRIKLVWMWRYGNADTENSQQEKNIAVFPDRAWKIKKQRYGKQKIDYSSGQWKCVLAENTCYKTGCQIQERIFGIEVYTNIWNWKLFVEVTKIFSISHLSEVLFSGFPVVLFWKNDPVGGLEFAKTDIVEFIF